MKKRVIVIALTVSAVILVLTAVPLVLLYVGDLIFAPGTPEELIKRSTGANVDGCDIIEYYDGQGGPHGDGTMIIIVDCSADPLDPSALEYWIALPLSENIKNSMWSIQGKVGTKYSGGVVRALTDGYYYFEDRYYEASDRHSDEMLTKRGSFNYTLAIYDKENETLYYFECDT